MELNDKNHKNENKKYVERAADILANLIRVSRKNLPSPEKEAKIFKKGWDAAGKLDTTFKENSRKLIDLIRKNRNK